ncbi:hypothetical protein [Luethyella okanaganae]|uniref:Uncharacterized protein n=1 Tax=Luethyella okanaganae TaxID=69372 RepID=A0ABW1VHJ6_9MICO
MSATTTPTRRLAVWDLVLTIVLDLMLVGIAAVATLFSAFLVMASDSCGSSVECDIGMFDVGWLIAFASPGVFTLIVLVISVILLILRRRAFWVPLAGIVLVVGVWFLGVWLVIASIPGATF